MNEARSFGPVITRDTAAALMDLLTELVIQAGTAILAINRGAMRVDGKLDGSPVTEADLAADRIIAEGLARIAPDIPALSEERVHLAKPPYDGSLFLIDEVLTPDSSRFWPMASYKPGISPPSFDKQFVRDYLESLHWNKKPPAPHLPPEILARTSDNYREALKLLTA